MRPPNLKNIWNQPASPVVRYSLPFIAILLALLLQSALMVVLPKGNDFPFAFFYLIAIFAVAWFGSYVPGVIACLLTMVGIPMGAVPGFSLAKLDFSRLGLLIGVSLAVSAVAHAQKRRREVLRQANDELDRRVKSRTEDLARSVKALEVEIAQHKTTEQKLQTQLERLNLLDQTTRAIAERQDPRSIFQVVIQPEDNLPIDFGCVCLYDARRGADGHLCRRSSAALAMELALTEQAHIKIDKTVYPDAFVANWFMNRILRPTVPFPQRLALAGLSALVVAPLRFESQVFGVRSSSSPAESFSSSELRFCDSLRARRPGYAPGPSVRGFAAGL